MDGHEQGKAPVLHGESEPAAYIALGDAGATRAGYATLVLGAIHWIQDRRWPVVWLMKKMGKDPGQTWLLIVFDNTLHLLQILGAAAWIVWKAG